MALVASRQVAERPTLVKSRVAGGERFIFGGAMLVWLGTRVLVLIHQGAWPWMNQFVVSGAQEIVNGNWGGAVRPPLPALLAVPLVEFGMGDAAVIAVLYLLASALQFVAYALVMRLAFPEHRRVQVLGLLTFLLVPFNHSIHHFRDVPVVFASSAVFLLSAHWLWINQSRQRNPWAPASIGWVLAATLLGVWSRTEVLSFIGVLGIVGLVVIRKRAVALVALYAVASVFGVGALQALDRAAGVDTSLEAQYQVHTFLDSTPQSWLSPGCLAMETENCRDADGAVIFGPIDRQAGVLGLLRAHPGLALAKTVRSALDNLWLIYGANPSTYPGFLWLGLAALLFIRTCRGALGSLPASVWCLAGAAFAVTVVPPLSWAPPHPQYHLHSLLAVGLLAAPLLAAVSQWQRGTLLVSGFYLSEAALSVVRYTRYPGY